MDLLSDLDRLNIRNAIKDVTDTFMKTPVVYTLSSGETLDRFNRGMGTKQEQVVNLMALAEYKDNEGEFGKELPDGIKNEAQIKLTYNLEDLQALNLIDTSNWTHPFKLGADTFTTQGCYYKLVWVGYDGSLDQKNVLVVMYGAIRDNRKELNAS